MTYTRTRDDVIAGAILGTLCPDLSIIDQCGPRYKNSYEALERINACTVEDVLKAVEEDLKLHFPNEPLTTAEYEKQKENAHFFIQGIQYLANEYMKEDI